MLGGSGGRRRGSGLLRTHGEARGEPLQRGAVGLRGGFCGFISRETKKFEGGGGGIPAELEDDIAEDFMRAG